MNTEFTKARPKDCDWLTWLGCAPIFDGGFVVNRSKEELEYHQTKTKQRNPCLEIEVLSLYNYSLNNEKSKMNRYIVSYYSEFEGELHQARLDAPDEISAVLIFLNSIGQKDAADVLSDREEFPTLKTIKDQLIQWDSAVAVMKL